MLLSVDEMIIFISDGFSSSLLLTWLPRQMGLSNITAHSLQNLLSFSKYYPGLPWGQGLCQVSGMPQQTRLIMSLTCLHFTKVADKYFPYFETKMVNTVLIVI